MSMRKSANLSATALAACSLMAGVAHADEAANGFVAALTGGTTKLDLRLRYERVEQDNTLDEADALSDSIVVIVPGHFISRMPSWLACSPFPSPCMMIFFSIKVKGLGGWVHELFCAPFGSKIWVWPANFLFNLIPNSVPYCLNKT